MAVAQAEVLEFADDGLIEVYPIDDFSKLPWRRSKNKTRRKRLPRPAGPSIIKNYEKAASQLANWLARDRSKTKNKALAHEIKLSIERCLYRVYSRLNPLYPAAQRVRHLLYELCQGDKSFYDQAMTGRLVRVPPPIKKFLLSQRRVTENGVSTLEHFIPDPNSRFRITVSVRGSEFKGESRVPQAAMKAFNLSPVPRRHVLAAIRSAEVDHSEGVEGTLGYFGHPNRGAIDARAQERRSHSDRSHLSLVGE